MVIDFLIAFWRVLGEMAPYLLLGFVVAGILSAFFSQRLIERHLGGKGFWPILKAALVGVPLPLCSCGVIPVSASLRRHGASKASTISFLIATPETGVDSILVTYSLLGPVFAAFRVVVAFVSGIIGGVAVAIFGKSDQADRWQTAQETPAEACSDGCDDSHGQEHCSSAETPSQVPGTSRDDCGGTCCTVQEEAPAPAGKVRKMVRYALLDLPQDIGPSLVVGLLIAAAITALVPHDFLTTQAGGFFAYGIGAMLLMMVIGIPMYVCATASVPMAMAMMMAGVSPGAAMVFLIVGPATNAATVSMIWRVMGPRTAVIYLLTVVSCALAAGMTLDAIWGHFQLGAHVMMDHEMGLAWWNHLAAVALVAIFAVAIVRKYRRRPAALAAAEANLETMRIKVGGMSCSHCVSTVRRVLLESNGVRVADVDLAAGLATVRGSRMDAAKLRAAVESLGYRVE